MRGYVHTQGGVFVGGKCYQYEFRTPYKVFSEALEAYIEKVKRLSEEEREEIAIKIKSAVGELGGEVKKVARNIEAIIGEVGELVKLEPEKERMRFLVTVVNFILSLGRAGKPLVIFLDDLQWSDEGSIEILRRVGEGIRGKGLVVIGSYRDNEVGEGHPLREAVERLRGTGVEVEEIEVSPLV